MLESSTMRIWPLVFLLPSWSCSCSLLTGGGPSFSGMRCKLKQFSSCEVGIKIFPFQATHLHVQEKHEHISLSLLLQRNEARSSHWHLDRLESTLAPASCARCEHRRQQLQPESATLPVAQGSSGSDGVTS